MSASVVIDSANQRASGGIGAIKGLLPHGPHNVRDILATHILKQTGSYEQASYAIQDTADTVAKHYGRFLPQDKAALAVAAPDQRVVVMTRMRGEFAASLVCAAVSSVFNWVSCCSNCPICSAARLSGTWAWTGHTRPTGRGQQRPRRRDAVCSCARVRPCC